MHLNFSVLYLPFLLFSAIKHLNFDNSRQSCPFPMSISDFFNLSHWWTDQGYTEIWLHGAIIFGRGRAGQIHYGAWIVFFFLLPIQVIKMLNNCNQLPKENKQISSLFIYKEGSAPLIYKLWSATKSYSQNKLLGPILHDQVYPRPDEIQVRIHNTSFPYRSFILCFG